MKYGLATQLCVVTHGLRTLEQLEPGVSLSELHSPVAVHRWWFEDVSGLGLVSSPSYSVSQHPQPPYPT